MPTAEPSRPWQSQKHQEILTQSNPTAFVQLAELALPHLIDFLRREFRQIDAHMHETAAIDSLLAYQRSPDKYDPDKLSLFGYLRLSARHDLLNAIDKHNRRKSRLVSFDEPDVQSQLLGNAEPANDSLLMAEGIARDVNQTEQAVLRQFEANLTGNDRQLFLLMLNGVRETEPYAEILHLSSAPLSEQRREVKRAKDRLTKSLTRFVNRHKV